MGAGIRRGIMAKREVVPLDYTTFTEIDPGNDFTVTQNKITVEELLRGTAGWIYYDYGAGYFSGDFVHQFEYKHTGGNSVGAACVWALANAVDGWSDLSSSGDILNVRMTDISGTIQIQAESAVGGAKVSTAAISVATGVQYYGEIERDESVGAYGTLYLRIYTDAERTVLHDSASVAIEVAKTDYRYLYAVQGYESGTIQWISFNVENLTLIS